MFKKFRTDMRSFNHTSGWKKNISAYLNNENNDEIKLMDNDFFDDITL